MTYKVWERKLKKGINALPKEERERVAEYYREMYDEMRIGGRSESSILAEFGSPERCAQQALTEGKTTRGTRGSSRQSERKRVSAAEAVGLFFFTLLVILPISVVAVSIVISFGAVCLSGGAIGIAGVVFAIAVPFMGIASSAIPVGIGMGIAASGIGCLLFVAFFYATKGAAIIFGKVLKAIYVRR